MRFAAILVICGMLSALATPASAQKPCGADANCAKVADKAAAEQVVLTPTVIEIGKWAEGIAFDGKSLWAAESGQRSLARIDLAEGRVVEHVKVGRLPVDLAASGDGDVYALVVTDKRIWRQSANGRRGTLTKLAECPQAMIDGGRALWVLTLPSCSSDSSRLIRVDRGGRQNQTGILGEWGQALTAHSNQIWVAHARGPALTVVDQDTLDATSVRVDGASLWAISGNSRNIFAGGRVDGSTDDGLVIMLDPDRRGELHRASVSQLVTKIISNDDHVVALGDKGTIWVFSARNLALQRTITLSTGSFAPRAAIFARGALLISTSKFSGEDGAVLVVADWLPGSAPVVAPRQRISPSFDCIAANSAAEHTICANNRLASLDKALNAGYAIALGNITSPAVGGSAADLRAFKDEQRAWLRKRDDCGRDEDCLFAAYQSRLRVIETMNQPE
ncbi:MULTISPECIES: lysozyme inhibitor LprI family protein [Rhodopseudomonas]|uniref:lysozyme inhibitor LprI family protein n=1 Tax=Rhodopseudomonas TaxID=1073 RepID=UPI0006960141|nr:MULTISPECIES: lysozyme inhibitor LprI family protein [Rhodopseudomonas]MDF3812101.1 lysozyme inhibitor LprI family protein [Rhodopseudomonas sp. BAL398]WOK16575.1 lysozyme inhibitor LprI family protein [Rhodopseudomonas sp. BAL398]